MPSFEEFLDKIKNGSQDLIRQHLSEVTDDNAKAYIDKLLDENNEKLKRWAKMIAHKELTTEEFEWLVRGLKDLSELEALKLQGMSKIKMEQLKSGVTDLIIKSAVAVYKD